MTSSLFMAAARITRSILVKFGQALWIPIYAAGVHLQNFHRDRRMGIRAHGSLPAGRDSGLHQDGQVYQAISHRRLNLVFAAVRWGPEDVFVDFGCGMGRVVCRAAEKPIRKVIGVEIDPGLAGLARQNAARLKGRRAPVEILCADAATVEVGEGTVFFFYDPFGWRTVRQVLANILASLLTHPRNVTIIFARWHRHQPILEMCDWLEGVETLDGDYIRIWRHTPDPKPRSAPSGETHDRVHTNPARTGHSLLRTRGIDSVRRVDR
jgi:SAM-dependent methyltransferase